MEKIPKFPPENPEEDAAIVDALISGSEEAFEKAGGKRFRGLTRKEALEDLSLRKKNNKVEAKDEEKEGQDNSDEQEGRMVERSTEWARSVQKDSVRGKFYQFLEKNFSEFRIETIPDEKNSDLLHVRATPYETDRDVLRDIEQNPIFRVLVISRAGGRDINEVVQMGRRLEEEGELPKGTTNRSLARFYAYEMAQFKKYLGKMGPHKDKEEGVRKMMKIYEERLKGLDEEPLTDGEMEIFFLQLVNQELEREG